MLASIYYQSQRQSHYCCIGERMYEPNWWVPVWHHTIPLLPPLLPPSLSLSKPRWLGRPEKEKAMKMEVINCKSQIHVSVHAWCFIFRIVIAKCNDWMNRLTILKRRNCVRRQTCTFCCLVWDGRILGEEDDEPNGTHAGGVGTMVQKVTPLTRQCFSQCIYVCVCFSVFTYVCQYVLCASRFGLYLSIILNYDLLTSCELGRRFGNDGDGHHGAIGRNPLAKTWTRSQLLWFCA